MLKKIILPILLIAIIVFTAGCSSPTTTTTTSSSANTTPLFSASHDYTASLVWDGQTRNYIYHVPANACSCTPMPLVFALHGGGGDAEQMMRLTHEGFSTLADREGFFVVYPTALDGKWNDGRDPAFSSSDDVGFIGELIRVFITNWNIDTTRIYVTGISNGSHMTMRLARDLSDKFAAAAAVAYAMSEKEAALEIASGPVSFLVMTGTEDPLIPWMGGNTTDLEGERMLGPILSVPDSVEMLISFDHCNLTPAVTLVPDNDPNDGIRVYVEDFTGGAQGTEVMFYKIWRGGHAWPVGYQYSVIVPAKTSRDIDANEVIWTFFQKHSK
jgi:polyhydroxybutyrate depolymerase